MMGRLWRFLGTRLRRRVPLTLQKAQEIIPTSLSRQEAVGVRHVVGGQALASGDVQRAGCAACGQAHQVSGQSLKLLHQALNAGALELHLTQAAGGFWHRAALTLRAEILRGHQRVLGLL